MSVHSRNHHHLPVHHQPLGRKAGKESSNIPVPIATGPKVASAQARRFVFDEAKDDDDIHANKFSTKGKGNGQSPAHHGRPRIPSKQDVLDYTFGVPDSPQNLSLTSSLMNSRDVFSLSPSITSRTSSAESLSTSFTEVISLNDPPKSIPSRQQRSKATPPFDPDGLHDICEDSLRPWNYLLTIPGKNVRDMLIQAFHLWIPSCHETHLVLIKQVIAYLHSASLVIDDIEDESLTRRGVPCAHIQFGLAPSLNAANYVYFLAMEKVLLLQSPEAVFCFTNEMLNLHRGQGRDIFWRTAVHFASEAEYLEMVQDKTGGLFRLAIRLMLSVATGKDRSPSLEPLLLELCNDMASFFQIRDDLINLASPEFHKKKGFCEDITEGKFSFIALHSLRTLQANHRDQSKLHELLALLQSKTTNREEIKHALRIMNSTKSFDYCLAYLDALKLKIAKLIDVNLGGNPKLSAIMNQLAADLEDCRDINRVLSS